MTQLFNRTSLRVKLILASVLVELVMLSILVGNGVRITEEHILKQAEVRVSEFEHLINTAIISSLLERDYATMQEVLDQTRRAGDISYLVLMDTDKKILASSGWETGKPLPKPEKEINTDTTNTPDSFDGEITLRIAGHTYGNLRYGMSLNFLNKAKRVMLGESIFIASMEIILSTILLIGIGIWLTRHLLQLSEASKSIAEGNLDIKLNINTNDEVGQVARAFNLMAESMKARLQDLKSKEEEFHAIADYTYDWESWYSVDKKLIWVNGSVERMTGYTVEECMNMEDFPFKLVVEEDREKAMREYSIAEHGSIGRAEFRVRCKDGFIFWAEAGWQPIYDRNGKYLGIRSGIRDITRQKEAELTLIHKVNELRESRETQKSLLQQSKQEQARMNALLSSMKRGILFEDIHNRVAYYNPWFNNIWMINENVDLTGKPVSDILKFSENILARPDNFSRHILNIPGTHEVSDSYEIPLADGRVITQICHLVRDSDNRFIGRLWIYEDVTRERQTAEQLIYLAERDSLTGLYNRRRFQEELSRVLEDTQRHNANGALLLFDLDEFKYINDTFGHRAGDTMLIRVAGEVGKLLRQNEVFSRLGGDEFGILLPQASVKDAETIAERVIRSIAQIPFSFEGKALRLTSSLGIAIFPDHSSAQEELIANADAAMYQAKDAGKNVWRIYNPDRDDSRAMVERISWNNRISNAIENSAFKLHFQGVYDTQTSTLTHMEALVRMVDEESPDQLIMPGRFIEYAEKSGRIIDIDRWVLRRCIQILAEDKLPGAVSIAVNISGRSFDDPTLPQYINELLKQNKVKPSRLYVEVTETSAVSDLHDAQRFIESLRKTGCKICLDDFGAGFSSFTYLKHLKVDILKIDGQFIRDLPNDHDNQVFVKSIVEVAHGLHKNTIAEFVEDADTLEMLKRFGVDMAQGYHLDKPSEDFPSYSI